MAGTCDPGHDEPVPGTGDGRGADLHRDSRAHEPRSLQSLEDGKLQLSLEQAIEIALERNLGLIVQRYNDAESTLNLAQTYGIYDLLATADVSTLSENSPSASSLDGAEVSTFRSNRGGISASVRLLKTGGNRGARFQQHPLRDELDLRLR